MILYFSGTGNSQLVAKQLAATLDDRLVCINDWMKGGVREPLYCREPYVLVAPVYAWRLPRVVSRWIQETSFAGSRKAYFVVTAGDSCGNAQAYAQQLCREKGLVFAGLAPVIMPENYIAMYPIPGPEEAKAIIAKAQPAVARIAAMIQAGEPLPPGKVTWGDKLRSWLINPLFYALYVSDRGFRAEDRCTSCGWCSRCCPLNNISMKEGHPQWNGRCTHCMACICGCPAEAIEYKHKSQGKPRYYVMNQPNTPVDHRP